MTEHQAKTNTERNTEGEEAVAAEAHALSQRQENYYAFEKTPFSDSVISWKVPSREEVLLVNDAAQALDVELEYMGSVLKAPSLSNGWESSNFHIRAYDGDHLEDLNLKISPEKRGRGEEHWKAVFYLCEHLGNGGVTIAHHRAFAQIPNGKGFAVLSNLVDKPRFPNGTPKDVYDFMANLGALHRELKSYAGGDLEKQLQLLSPLKRTAEPNGRSTRLDPSISVERFEKAFQAAASLEERDEGTEALLQNRELLTSSIEQAIKKQEEIEELSSEQLLQINFHPHNLIRSEDDGNAFIIDFDQVNRGGLHSEIGLAMVTLIREGLYHNQVATGSTVADPLKKAELIKQAQLGYSSQNEDVPLDLGLLQASYLGQKGLKDVSFRIAPLLGEGGAWLPAEVAKLVNRVGEAHYILGNN